MALMTVNDDDTDDFRSKPRWSARKKLDVVLRLRRSRSPAAPATARWRPASCPGAAPAGAEHRRRYERVAGRRSADRQGGLMNATSIPTLDPPHRLRRPRHARLAPIIEDAVRRVDASLAAVR